MYPDDLLRVAGRLLARRKGQKGPLKGAHIRRSISTTYYAVFHFVLDEAARCLVGAGGDLRQRRRLFVRTLSHEGLNRTFEKLKGAEINASVADLFRRTPTQAATIPTPPFVRQMAEAYLDAKSKREDADYDLNEPLSAKDAVQLGRRVARAIRTWRAAEAPADRDAKHAVAILLSLKGQIRS